MNFGSDLQMLGLGWCQDGQASDNDRGIEVMLPQAWSSLRLTGLVHLLISIKLCSSVVTSRISIASNPLKGHLESHCPINWRVGCQL